MEKPELVSVISGNTGISQEDSIKIIDSFVETIKEELLKGEKVTISGFGTFMLSRRKGKTFVNPKTNKSYEIPDKLTPKFKPGSDLKSI